MKEDLTVRQSEVAEQLLTEHPLVWGRESVAELFNVSIESVEKIEVSVQLTPILLCTIIPAPNKVSRRQLKLAKVTQS